MMADGARRFTLNILFRADTVLNWLLGCVLVFFPSMVDDIIGRQPLAPPLVYQAVGAGFLLFAAWQTFIVIGRQLGMRALVFAALMAEIPVILLTAALVFMNLDLEPVWRLVLWLGNVYMLVLGAWYIFLARRLARQEARPGPKA